MPTAPRTHRAHTPQPRRDYDRYRGTAAERGYDAAWNKLRVVIRQRDDYLCQECRRQGRITPAREVDHIEPIRVAPERRLDETNLEVLCHSCHVRKTHEDERKYGCASHG